MKGADEEDNSSRVEEDLEEKRNQMLRVSLL